MTQLSNCPLCHGNIRVIIKSFIYNANNQSFSIPNIKYYVCMTCGENYLDEESSRKTDEYREE
ncbi:YgiT-type zinc finger protein [Brevibacillus sp. CF112]|uniref:YgiT-type zinc finger protein n=1 Tax=Brevibacillus TaxID=55080 RepID=UPI0012F6BE83